MHNMLTVNYIEMLRYCDFRQIGQHVNSIYMNNVVDLRSWFSRRGITGANSTLLIGHNENLAKPAWSSQVVTAGSDIK